MSAAPPIFHFEFDGDQSKYKQHKSLWQLFLDAIQQCPKMDRLKNVIKRASVERDSYEQDLKR